MGAISFRFAQIFTSLPVGTTPPWRRDEPSQRRDPRSARAVMMMHVLYRRSPFLPYHAVVRAAVPRSLKERDGFD